jgi:two-component system cell cycle sensor histidine kinase/response regulator CckA
MMSAPRPPDEDERLATLKSYGILDTLPEEAFDDLVLLASQICGTPMAQVSLVDGDRQWFKAKVGLVASETPRDVAFCAHTILDTGNVLEVPDAQADPRFAGSPLVTAEPRIRFYAGTPLVSPEGHALGALCVMDHTPRHLLPDQVKALRALGRRVVAQLELRRQSQELVRQAAVAEKTRRALLSVLEDEKRTGRSLRESEERFRQVVENIQEVFWMSDVEKSTIIYLSPGYEKIWGRPCAEVYAASRTWIESIHADDRDRVLKAAVTRQAAGTYDETYRILRPDGEIRWIRDRAFPVKGRSGKVERIVGVAADITGQKKLEEQFLHAQRMEAIGTLASGVAHDLNNILAPMLMVAGILKLRPNASARDLELLALVESSGQRGAGIIRQLLTFSRGLSGEKGPLQPKHLIHEMAKIMGETFPRNIAIAESTPADLWTVEADATQLHQVIMNLCVNARDAMPAGGNLTIEAANLTLGPNEAMALDPTARPGPYVRLQVRDTGTGIPPEIINRIFEPFFTTKGVGKGTGLGLSTVVGIVRGHAGYLKVSSEPGRGSTFAVYLPAANRKANPDLVDATKPQAGGQGELILVVDDEGSIREAMGSLLEHHGYRVVVATNGEEGMREFLQNQGTVRLVVTDIMMPAMDGVALIRSIRLLAPSLPIIATSGLDQSQHTEELAGLGVGKILAKPFAPIQLLKEIANALVS